MSSHARQGTGRAEPVALPRVALLQPRPSQGVEFSQETELRFFQRGSPRLGA